MNAPLITFNAILLVIVVAHFIEGKRWLRRRQEESWSQQGLAERFWRVLTVVAYIAAPFTFAAIWIAPTIDISQPIAYASLWGMFNAGSFFAGILTTPEGREWLRPYFMEDATVPKMLIG